MALTGEYEIDDYHSLAVRDLQRGQGVGLPSVRKAMRAPRTPSGVFKRSLVDGFGVISGIPLSAESLSESLRTTLSKFV